MDILSVHIAIMPCTPERAPKDGAFFWIIDAANGLWLESGTCVRMIVREHCMQDNVHKISRQIIRAAHDERVRLCRAIANIETYGSVRLNGRCVQMRYSRRNYRNTSIDVDVGIGSES